MKRRTHGRLRRLTAADRRKRREHWRRTFRDDAAVVSEGKRSLHSAGQVPPRPKMTNREARKRFKAVLMKMRGWA